MVLRSGGASKKSQSLPDYSAVMLLVVFPADWVGADVGVSVTTEWRWRAMPSISVVRESFRRCLCCVSILSG